MKTSFENLASSSPKVTRKVENAASKNKLTAVFSALLLSACEPAEESPRQAPINLERADPIVSDSPKQVKIPDVETVPVKSTSYVVDEHLLSLTTTFSVAKNGKPNGEVVKTIFSLTPTYTYSNNAGECLAIGRRAMMSWGNKVNVTDCGGKDLATIHENVAETFFGAGFKTSYRITGEGDQVLASSVGTKFLATSFDVKDSDGSSAMHANRPMLNIGGDKWTMTVEDSKVDERVFVLLVSFKTDADNERESKIEDDEKKKDDRDE